MSQAANNDMWLVVHTPKTAGTSLRWALQKYFGKSNIICDYGPQSDATSDVVRKHLYSGDDSKGPGSLITEISADTNRVLIGHFHLSKYGDYFETQNIITFVRDPLVRACSEYLHRIKQKTFTGTFSEFLQRPAFQNVQVRLLKGVSEDSFIGITEHYAESLQGINRIAGWNLSVRRKNVAWRGGGQKFAEKLSADEVDMFYKINAKDEELYQFAKRRFATLGN